MKIQLRARSFSDDAPGTDLRYFGKPMDKRFPSSFNLITTMSKPVKGSLAKASLYHLQDAMRKAHAASAGEGSRPMATRQSYKDEECRSAFKTMDEVASSLRFSAKATEFAKDLFATFRKNTELLRNKKVIIAACLVSSVREIREESATKRPSSFIDDLFGEPKRSRGLINTRSCKFQVQARGQALSK